MGINSQPELVIQFTSLITHQGLVQTNMSNLKALICFFDDVTKSEPNIFPLDRWWRIGSFMVEGLKYQQQKKKSK